MYLTQLADIKQILTSMHPGYWQFDARIVGWRCDYIFNNLTQNMIKSERQLLEESKNTANLICDKDLKRYYNICYKSCEGVT